MRPPAREIIADPNPRVRWVGIGITQGVLKMNGTDATFAETVVRSFDRLERYIVALFYGEGLSSMEIGLVLDLPQTKVEVMLEAIRDRTRSALEKWNAT